MSSRIYVVYNKPADLITSKVFTPIQSGRACTELKLDMLGDDSGDNISTLNDSFCELSALYWIWKNDKDSSSVGVMHYRRHLNLSPKTHAENEWGVTVSPVINDLYLEKNYLLDDKVESISSKYDLILPKRWDVRNAGSINMRDHYASGSHHFIEDYDTALRIVARLHPSYSPYIREVNDSYEGYFTNIMIMKKQIYDEYCSWLFSILFELKNLISIENYSFQEQRVFGYISEWLLNIYVAKLRKDKPALRLLEAQRTFVEKTDLTRPIRRVFDGDAILIIMSFHSSFAPYAAATISSVLFSTNRDSKYDIVVLESSLDSRTKELFKGLSLNRPNVSIRFYNVSHYFGDLDLPNHMHFSKETYYRLMIPDIFEHYERAIYIDSDVVVQRDLRDLFEVDLEGRPIAGVKDYTMQGFRKLKVPSMAECGGRPADEYLRYYLGLKEPDGYFQAGVLLFDLNLIRRAVDYKRWINLLANKIYWMSDQDLMNIMYEGKVTYLDFAWNVVHGNGRVEAFYEKLPAKSRERYFKARLNPFIVHFAGERKPWNVVDIDFAELFWAALRRTPWYEIVLINSMNDRSASGLAVQSRSLASLNASSSELLELPTLAEQHHHHHHYTLRISVISMVREIPKLLSAWIRRVSR